jgi:hypothetical protein
MKAIEVKALSGYSLQVSFNDGVSGIINLSSFVQKGVFSVLQNEAEFGKVYITNDALAWNEDLEIDLVTIYEELVRDSPALVADSVPYAAN